MEKAKVKKIIGMLACICLLLGIVLPTIGVTAKTVNGIITNVTIKNEHGVKPDSMTEWDYIHVHMDWAIPDNQVEAGDEMTIQLPNELRFVENMEFDILDEEGNVVAKAICSKEDKTLKLIFTDYAETHSGVHGDFWFATLIERSQVENGDTIRPEFIVEGEVLVGNEFEFVGEVVDKEALLNKYGVFGSDKNKIEYNIRVGMADKEVKDATVTDRLANEGVSYDKGSFQVFEATWTISGTGDWEAKDLNLVPSIKPVFDAGERGFAIALGDIAAHKGYLIKYVVDIDYEALPGEIFENSANLYSGSEEIEYDTAYTTHYTGGGTGAGYVGEIILTKKGPDKELLAGAHFDVIRISTGRSVGEIITDSNGIGSIGKLLADNYKIIETRAPEGYELDDTPIIINADDWGEEKIIHLEVENVRKTTPTPEVSKTPTPEVSKTPTPEVSKTPTPEVSKTPTPEVSKTPTPEVSKTPTPEVSKTPTPEVSKTPTPKAIKTPTPTDKNPQGGKGTSAPTTLNSVKTGDTTDIIIVVGMLILSLAGITYAFIARNKE